MAQASSSRSRLPLRQIVQRFVLQWLDLLPSLQPIVPYATVSKRWLVSGAALIVLLLWNWRFVVSLGLGLMTLAIGYLLQQGQGKRLWAKWQPGWQRWWETVDRAFVLTVAGSIGVTGTSYLALSIWRELGSSWLAIGFLLQGAAVWSVLGLVAWQSWRQSQISRSPMNTAFLPLGNGEAKDAAWLNDLADADPLKRLLAVRQLTHALTRNQPGLLLTPQELAESFRLMLNRETEPIVCRALLESLQRLDACVPALPASHQPTVQVIARTVASRTIAAQLLKSAERNGK